MATPDTSPGRGGKQAREPRLDAADRIPSSIPRSWDPDDIFLARKGVTRRDMCTLIEPGQADLKPEAELTLEERRVGEVSELPAVEPRNTSNARIKPTEPNGVRKPAADKPTSWDIDDIYFELHPLRR